MAKYPSKVRLQFRNFPLSHHPQAGLAHEGAMAAARQGHFWEVTNYLFDHQDKGQSLPFSSKQREVHDINVGRASAKARQSVS